MTLNDFLIEIDYHILMLETILEYKNEDGVCAVSQFEIATRINKKQSWVSKAIKRLNSEDTCVEQIEKGKYKIHYTNIKEHGVFPKIIKLMIDKATLSNFREKEVLLREKYGISKRTIQIFSGYLGFLSS